LYENHLLKIDPQDVAQFLYKGEGLNKTAIGKLSFNLRRSGFIIFDFNEFSPTPLGEYLGEKKPFNEQVLKAFVELHDFTNLILVQALR
jgi:cytohesin